MRVDLVAGGKENDMNTCDFCDNPPADECGRCGADLCCDCADWDQATGEPVCPGCLAAESDPVAQE